PLFAGWSLEVVAFYARSQRVLGRPLARRLGDTLAAVTLGIGMSPSQTVAVIQGLLPGTGEFVRTPKAGDAAPALHYPSRISNIAGLELVVAVWLAWGIHAAAVRSMWGALPFLVPFFASFAWVGTM